MLHCLPNCFLYTFEAKFKQGLMKAGKKKKKKKKKKKQTPCTTIQYKDDVLSLNNLKFSGNLEFIHPRELEIIETSETIISAS